MHPSPLPVPADRLIDGNWVGDPFNTNLPFPQMPFFMQRPDLTWVIATTAAVLVVNLQDNCQGGPVSTFAYNLFSQNFFANEYFMLVVSEATDFALSQLNVMRQGEQPQAVVSRATTFYAGYAAAACARNFPALQQYITQDQAARVNQIIQQWNAMSAGLNQQQQQPHHVGMQQQPMYGQPVNRVNRGIYGAASNDIGQMCVGANVGVATTGVGTYAFNPGQHQENSKFGKGAADKRLRPDNRIQEITEELADLGVVETLNTQAPFQRRAVDNRIRPESIAREESNGQSGVTISNDIPEVNIFTEEELSEEWASTVTFNNEPREPYVLDDTVVKGHFLFRPKHVAVDLPATFEEAELEEEEDLEVLDIVGLSNGGDDWSLLELRDGTVAVQVSPQDPGRTWSIDSPHSHPYNPEKFIRYLVAGEDEVCYEAFLARDENVDYSDLEFDSAKRARARQEKLSAQTILADLSVLQEIVPNGLPYTLINAVEELTVLENGSDQQKLLDGIERFQGKLSFFEAATGAAEIHQVQTMVERFFQHVTARNVVAASAGFYDRQFVVPGLATKVEAYSTTPVAKRLPKLFILLSDLGTGNSRAYLYLNEWLTKEVNVALNHAMGLESLVIGSFSEDYFDLLGVVEKEYSETALQSFNEALEKVLGTVTLTYSGDILNVRHAYRLMGLPVGLASFDLPTAAGESYRVTASASPELYTLIRGMEKDEAAAKKGKTFLSGTDGELFEVIDSVWDDGFVTLLRVNKPSL